MSTIQSVASRPVSNHRARAKPLLEFPDLRALAWHDQVLFASHGYTLLSANMLDEHPRWRTAAYFRPAWWRNLSASVRLSSRLCRDGFHALVVLPSHHLVAAVPGAIITAAPGEIEFHVSHEISRGTRPLHLTATPEGHIYWGEYFSNRGRDEVHIYRSGDRGLTWDVIYTFPRGTIRHVHNIIYDQWDRSLWILTGDEGPECRIIRASLDFSSVDVVRSGSQQVRAVAFVPTREALYFASDTPLEKNHIYRLSRTGSLVETAEIDSSAICGCRVGSTIFFSTMAEPSRVNPSRSAIIYRSGDGDRWGEFFSWRKDSWPMQPFQYGTALLPDGNNATDLLAVSTSATVEGDQQTSVWRT